MAKRTPEEHRAIVEELARKQRTASAKNKASNTRKRKKKRAKRVTARDNNGITTQRMYNVLRFTARNKWEEL